MGTCEDKENVNKLFDAIDEELSKRVQIMADKVL